MYRGIVQPHFSYCCFVWGCCSETKHNSLQKFQKRAAIITTNIPYDAPAVPLLQNLGWALTRDLILDDQILSSVMLLDFNLLCILFNLGFSVFAQVN